jgi:hypothetical protein
VTQQRRRRLEHLEALARLRKPERPFVDPAPFVIPIFEAMIEGRPFEWIPSPDGELPEEAEQARRLRLAELDSIAGRLETNDPGSAAKFQADIERRLAANMQALEREQAEREAT